MVFGQITHHLFRRDIVNEVNGYNESLKFNEDFEFLLRIAKKGLFFELIGLGLYNICEQIHGVSQIHIMLIME